MKRAALRGTRALGFEHAVLDSSWRRSRVAILCYHGISLDDEHLWDPRYYMPADLLESRLRLLRDLDCRVLPLGEAVRRLKEKSLPPRSVVITFDDGCYDFYARAFPLLREYRVPATVYLTSFYCRCARPIFTFLCRYVLWKAGLREPSRKLLPGFDFAADLGTDQGRADAMERIESETKKRGLRLAAKFELAEQLARDLEVDIRPFSESRCSQIMRPPEVQEVAAAGYDIELHTHRHRTPEDPALFRREIDDNRRAILEMTGVSPVHFCYPGGAYRRAFLAWLEEVNVVSATTCDSGLASPGDHPLLLPRVTDHSQLSTEEFVSWISGVRYLMTGARPRRGAGAER